MRKNQTNPIDTIELSMIRPVFRFTELADLSKRLWR
jgi:hypothetical protein